MHLEGLGRNRIAHELNLSQGSVSNILKAWKGNKDNESAIATATINQLSKSVEEITQSGQGQAAQDLENDYSLENSKKGGPLSWFTSRIDVNKELEAPQTQTQPFTTNIASMEGVEVDFSDIPHPDFYPDETAGEVETETCPPNPRTLGETIFLSEDNIETTTTNQPTPTTEEPNQSQPRSRISDSHVGPEPEIDFSDTPVNLKLEEDAFLLQSDPLLAWRRVFRRISKEKDQRRHQLLLLERKKILLENEEKRISSRQQEIIHDQEDLVVRESVVSAAEPFLQAAYELQNLGLDINSVLPWLETIREKAQVERTTVDVAAISVAQELRNYRILGGLQSAHLQVQKEIEIAEGQLKMINITIAQKEKPLLILAEFQTRGINLEKICLELRAGPGPFGNNHSNYSYNPVNCNGQKAQSYLGQNLGSNNNHNSSSSGDKGLELINQIWDQVEKGGKTTSSQEPIN